MRVGVALGWHVHPWEDLLALVRRAEALGYAAAYVDGDATMLERRREQEVLDGWTVTTALLARTECIGIGSMRLPHHWNAARLAQAAATAERIAPGRLRFLVSAGDRPIDARFGLPLGKPPERIRRLDETLTAVRALWSGRTVTLEGRTLRLEGARLRPTPPGGRIPIEIAAKGPRMLELVAAHADVWEINLPPLAERVAGAAARLAAACRARGRDPGEIGRSLWIYARLGDAHAVGAALADYRRLNPWFAAIPDREIRGALLVGGAAELRERIAETAERLALELPVVDCSGLAAAPAAELLEALAQGNFLR